MATPLRALVCMPLAALTASAATPGALRAAEPPRLPHASPLEQKREGAALVIFAGFHLFADGSSRLWVKLDRNVKVTEQVVGQRATFVLHDARVDLKNNKNPLLARHFGAMVVKARLIQDKIDTKLVVTMQRPAQPIRRTVKRPDGFVSVQIDFPPLR